MIKRSEIKQISKNQLNRNGNWKIPVILTAVTVLIAGFSGSNSTISESATLSIAVTIITSLINIYFVKCCLQIAKSYEDEKIQWADILVTGNVFMKCILYSIIISLLVTIISLGIALLGGTFMTTIPVLTLIIGIIGILVGGVISIYAAFSIFIIIDRDADIFEALKISASLIRGHFWQMIILSLSFIWWYILGMLTLGLALFWIIPYMTISYCNYYLHLYGNKYN